MSERAIRNVELGSAGDFAAMDLLNPEVLRPRLVLSAVRASRIPMWVDPVTRTRSLDCL
jgi:hypothetical protein